MSTKEQAEGGYSIQEQEARLRKYCEAMQWTIYKVYCDPGFSGAYLERPALNSLREDIKAGKIDAVLVWKLDRLSRSQKDTLYLIEDCFINCGIAFISTLENFDTSSPFGRAMIGILSVFAQLEREQIKERMQLGLDARAKDGKWHGGGFDPFGYDYIDGELVINEQESAIVRKVYELYLDKGWAVSKIKKYLNERYKTKYGNFESDSTILNILTNPIYIGRLRWKNETYNASHAPIIPEQRFLQVQKYREDHKWQTRGSVQKRSPFAPSYILSGLLYCANCGARYFVKGNYSGRGENKKYYPYYTCYSRGKTDKKYIKDPSCKNPSIATEKLDRFILEQIKALSLDPNAVSELIEKEAEDGDLASQILEQEKQIKAKELQINNLIELCKIGGGLPIQAIASQIEAIQKEIEKHKKAIESIKEDQAVELVSSEEIKDQFLSAARIIERGEFEELRALVVNLIEKIEILPDGNIKIFWNF